MAAAKRSAAEVVTGAVIILIAAGFLAYALVSTGQGGQGGLNLSAQFDNVGTVTPGSEVRLSGVKVGTVTGLKIDPRTFQAIVDFSVRSDLKLPTDSSAVISTGGLLGGQFLTLSPGGSDKVLTNGGVITVTQSATNIEELLGKFIFNVGSLADATQKSLREKDAAPPAPSQ